MTLSETLSPSLSWSLKISSLSLPRDSSPPLASEDSSSSSSLDVESLPETSSSSLFHKAYQVTYWRGT